MPTEKQTLEGPGGLTLELDPAEVFPDDPGAGTPALVVWKGPYGEEFTATLAYAADMGHLDGKYFFYELTPEQRDWLYSDEVEEAVEAMYTAVEQENL